MVRATIIENYKDYKSKSSKSITGVIKPFRGNNEAYLLEFIRDEDDTYGIKDCYIGLSKLYLHGRKYKHSS